MSHIIYLAICDGCLFGDDLIQYTSNTYGSVGAECNHQFWHFGTFEALDIVLPRSFDTFD